MNVSDCLVWIFAAICAAFSWFFGKVDGPLVALITFCCVDQFTGILAAAFNGALSSRIGFKGISKKVVIFALIGVAHLTDKIFSGEAGVFRELVIYFYCANEGMSILENADKLGVPFPEQLKKIFAQMRDKGDNNQNDNSIINKKT